MSWIRRYQARALRPCLGSSRDVIAVHWRALHHEQLAVCRAHRERLSRWHSQGAWGLTEIELPQIFRRRSDEHAAVRRALEGALNGMSPAPTAWENAKFSPVTGTAYQSAHLMPAEPDNPVYGDEYAEQGIFQITLYYPEGNGPAAAMARAELI